MPKESTTERALISVAESVGSAVGSVAAAAKKNQDRYHARGVDAKARKKHREQAANTRKKLTRRSINSQRQEEPTEITAGRRIATQGSWPNALSQCFSRN